MPLIVILVFTCVPVSTGHIFFDQQLFCLDSTKTNDPPPKETEPTTEKAPGKTETPKKDASHQTQNLYDAVTSKKTKPGPKPIIVLLDVKDADLVDVLRFLCEKGGAQLVVDPSVGHVKVTCRLENISWLHAAHIIIKNAGLDAQFEAGILKTGN